MRIASLIPKDIVNSIYRSFVPMQALALRGHAIHIEERNEVQNAAALLEFDVVHFVRFCHEPMQQLSRRLSEAGIAMIWDNDDNLTAAPKGNPNYRQRHGLVGHQIRTAMAGMMRRADVVTTPSPFLAEAYREASGADVRVIENYLPPTFPMRRRARRGSPVTIGWIAGSEHQRDVERLRLRETFDRLLAEHRDVQVVNIGVSLGIRSERYHHIPYAPYEALPGCIAQFDVGVAPLADIPFNQGRSNVKLKEYAALGVPWLASSIGPYAGLGEEQGGRLVADGDWYEQLVGFVQDAKARDRLGRRAERWAREQTIERHTDRWEQVLEDAFAHARARTGAA
jgi:glycosyltransferase involved in cell wall biosynthesis